MTKKIIFTMNLAQKKIKSMILNFKDHDSKKKTIHIQSCYKRISNLKENTQNCIMDDCITDVSGI